MTEADRIKLDWLDAIVRTTFKGQKVILTEADIKPGRLYVLDWRPEEPDNFDSITVEHVESIEPHDGRMDVFGMSNAVAIVGPPITGRSRIFVSDMVELAVGGPFPAEVQCTKNQLSPQKEQ